MLLCFLGLLCQERSTVKFLLFTTPAQHTIPLFAPQVSSYVQRLLHRACVPLLAMLRLFLTFFFLNAQLEMLLFTIPAQHTVPLFTPQVSSYVQRLLRRACVSLLAMLRYSSYFTMNAQP